ncbi:MAG: carbohydrate ABC transporter permease [Actinomycetes bacterium]
MSGKHSSSRRDEKNEEIVSTDNAVTEVKRRRRRKISPFTYVALGVMTFISAFPFYWMFVVASNGSDEISKIPPSLKPGTHFPQMMSAVYEAVPFNRSLLNTFMVAIIIAVSQVFFSSLAGFAFAKMEFPGKKWMLIFVVGTMMLPSQLGVIPMYMMMSKLNWIDNFKALIIPALVSAFGVFWMRQVIDAQIPNELLEAARIDGASVFRIYRSIIVPVVRSSAFVLGLFSFLATWNDFLWPLLVMNSPEKFTVQVAINQLQSSYVIDYALNMGGAFMATAPLLVLFIFVGKRLVAGVMDGAVKG